MGTGRGKGTMVFLQRRNGKSKSVEVGKHRPSSGNAISLTELHLNVLAHEGRESRLEWRLARW